MSCLVLQASAFRRSAVSVSQGFVF